MVSALDGFFGMGLVTSPSRDMRTYLVPRSTDVMGQYRRGMCMFGCAESSTGGGRGRIDSDVPSRPRV